MAFHPLNDPAEIPDSYWAATAAPLAGILPVEGKLEADVAVIGAGFTGLSTALHLAEAGVNVVVVDAHQPGWGASGRNNGQVVAEMKHEYYEMVEKFGTDRADRLITAVGTGPDLVFELIRRFQMECAATRGGIITAAHNGQAMEKLRKRTEAWRRRGAPLELLDKVQSHAATGSEFFVGAVRDPRGGAINPLAYARGLARACLARGVRLYGDSRAERLERDGPDWRVILPRGEIRAAKVVLATNAYSDNLWKGLKRTVLPVRTPQVVSDPLPDQIARTILPGREIMSDTRKLIVGVRTHPDGRLHLGGRGGVTGADRKAPFERLIAEARNLYPNLPPLTWRYQWSGFVALTPDFYPRLFELAPGVASCLGYSGRGVAMATLMGRELSGWAQGAHIDDLVLPQSSFRTLPYYDFQTIAVEGSMAWYRLQEKFDRKS